jgi:hypothetical protein
MSRQGLLWPLWHESLAEPRTSWASGRPGHGRLVYGSAGLPAGGGLFGNDLRNLWLTCLAAVAWFGRPQISSTTQANYRTTRARH